VQRSSWRAALFLTMSDPAAHPALLAPYLATSFASATTGHAFSSGVSGKYPVPNKNRRYALSLNENTDSTRKSVIISRSVGSKTGADDCLIVCARRLTKPMERCRSTAKAREPDHG
jgi:hypothetical protein